ncbi:MAG TPA: TonB-dependent receptor [Longimicrobium sp.]|nr:TonB-dependent receptor [Longimicrobium sp.]
MRTPVVRHSRLATALLRAAACLALFLGLGAAPLAAQGTGRVTGTVSGADGAPVADATVVVVGTTLAARTGPDGRYTLTGVPAGTHQVRASRLGMASGTRTVTVAAGGEATANFTLGAQTLLLDTMVAVGYTTQNERTVSDAVARVAAEDLQDQQVATVEEALRGRVAGVNIVSSGEPGRSSRVVVRGQNFLSAADPLYVVDGMYTRQAPHLNPDDIESVEVLKDASAAAQYGAQSANGVILIRTRRGTAGAPRFSVNTYYGWQDVPNRIEMVDSERWLQLAREARANAADPAIRATANQPFSVPFNTDWQDAVLQTGAVQDHNLAVSGGTESASYLVSAGYFEQDGTVMNTGFERYSFRVNSEIRRGRFKIGENASFARFERDNVIGFPLIDAIILTPVIGVRDPSNLSGYGFGSGRDTDFTATFGTNPVGAFEREDNRDLSHRLLGNLYGEVSLVGGLRYRLNLGVDYEDLNWRQFLRVRQVRQNTVQSYNEGRDRRDQILNLLAENLLMFDGGRGEHQLSAVAGISEQINDFDRVEAYGTTFPNENITVISAATANLDNDAFSVPSSLRGYLVRANYSYAERYLLTGTFRRDGSSRFGPGNKWGNFASGSVGWVLSEEDFFGGLPVVGTAVDYLKLRASYGSLGNQDIGDFQYQARIIGNQSYPFGGSVASGATQIRLANPDIRWQDQTQVNVGVDFNVLDNALQLSADYYVSESDGLLVSAPIPRSLGSGWTDPVDNTFGGNTLPPTVNAGSVRNSGFEVGARYNLARGDLELDLAANLTTIDNEVTALGNGGQPIFAGFANVSRTTVGGSIGEFYLVRTDGIFQSAAEVQAHRSSNGTVIQPNAKPGDVRFVDVNDDGRINDDDREVAGSPIPELEGGLHMNATFRRFNVGLGLRGSYGAEVFNVARYWNERGDENHNFREGYNPWRPDNTGTDDPRLVFGREGADNARANSDRWLEDGSYLRIQNVVLGYRIPESLTSRFGVSTGEGTRVYLNIQNLHTFTSFSNWDPEIRGFDDPLSRGIDDGRIYPNARTVTIGLDLNL